MCVPHERNVVIIGASLSEHHIAVVSFALLSVYLLPALADCAKIDRMWVPEKLLPLSAFCNAVP